MVYQMAEVEELTRWNVTLKARLLRAFTKSILHLIETPEFKVNDGYNRNVLYGSVCSAMGNDAALIYRVDPDWRPNLESLIGISVLVFDWLSGLRMRLVYSAAGTIEFQEIEGLL